MSRPHWRVESVEVRRQQQCPDKCRILSELLGVGFFNFHQYCACYSTFFLFVIVILYMWKIHTLRIFCYQPIGDGFVDKHIVEWFFLMHGHILFCVLILKFKSYFVLLGNFVFSNTIQDVKNVIFKVVVGQNHIQYSNHDLKTPTLNIFQFFDRIFIITHHGWGPSSWRLHRCIYLYMFWSDHHLSWLKTFQLQAP